ncbi:MAG: NADH-quinone oxidoreductase subunit NuoG [Solirubrobacterales bacterium]|nr:NADH-quinone oxidoreductase subunit NuoG [Solirubrobacterales bacterium]
MPRPEHKEITLTIDGRDVPAIDGQILVDAARGGDIEIPVFCYEPKIGGPVGACRMCLVEIEGISKLQTACSTPVKDGMVVHTQTDRVKGAQQSVVEFLLVNHPLDCPVCDKGGECPLQDISYGYGGGKSRFIEPKRHFVKPLGLSPLIAIDRERCILCYRCVRFSQEVSEDHQLVLLERGASTFVATFDGHPYVAPFSGNIIELCPVGALTSRAYRFRARPWDIEGSGSVCNLCPAQCNVTFTVRDDRVLRVLSRDHDGVDDGWLCDKGRFAYQATHSDERITAPLVRDGDQLRPATWERAIQVASGIARHSGAAAAIVGGETTNEEGLLLGRYLRDTLASHDIDSRQGGALSAGVLRELARTDLQATVPDLEFAHTVLLLDADPVDDAPILDLRIRKGARRNGAQVLVASGRPTALDARAAVAVRHAPGSAASLVLALDAALSGDQGSASSHATDAGSDLEAINALAEALKAGGEDVVIVWGERVTDGAGGEAAAKALVNISATLGLGTREGSGLLELPRGTNGRGLREVGAIPTAGPGLSNPVAVGRSTDEIAAAAAAGDVTALWFLHADPTRDGRNTETWTRAMASAGLVIAHASTLSPELAAHATVVFPAEAGAERDGTITHPDGRIQRLRKAIGSPVDVRPAAAIIARIAEVGSGVDLGPTAGPAGTAAVSAAVSFYAGLNVDEIGGRGLRWQDRDAATNLPAGDVNGESAAPVPAASPNGALRLGTYRSIWASPEVELSPALKFLSRRPTVELSPIDAERIGVTQGQNVDVGTGADVLRATAHLRSDVPAGSIFVESGLAAPGNLPSEGQLIEVNKA